MRPYTCSKCKRELIHNGMRGPLPKLCAECKPVSIPRVPKPVQDELVSYKGFFLPFLRRDWHAVVYGGRRR